MAGKFQPLNQDFAIVKANGLPTEYFIRWAQQRQIDITTAVTFGDLAAINVVAGVGLTGGGPIDADVTVDLENTAVAPGTYGDATHSARITIDPQGRITSATDVAISGGGGGGAPAIRASNLVKYASAASFSHPLPTGAADGDFVVIFYSGGFGDASVTSPSGALWDTFRQGAANWGGTIFVRRITADDVSAGSVTITPTGSFDAVIGAVCFTGNAQLRYPILEMSAQAIVIHSPGAGAASSTQKSAYAESTDCVLCFFSNRASSSNTTTYGTLLQTTTNANGSGALYANAAPTAGGQSATLTYGTAGSGRHELLLVVRGAV